MDETRRMCNFLVILSYMEIGLNWYQKGTNNKWIYDLSDHLMVDLETIIALAIVTYIEKLYAHELHLEDEFFSTTLLMKARI